MESDCRTPLALGVGVQLSWVCFCFAHCAETGEIQVNVVLEVFQIELQYVPIGSKKKKVSLFIIFSVEKER